MRAPGSQTCYPRVHQARQAIPEFNGGTLDIREAHRLQGISQGEPERTATDRGMLGLRNSQTVDNPHCRKLQSRHKA